MNNITQIQVFVSNPSDVNPEKFLVEEVCHRINRDFLQGGCSIQFIVREWSEVFGQIGIPAQDSINTTIRDYDIYIGILWMKFGTPTKNINPNTGHPYQSGTEEEFERAYDRWKSNHASVRINCFFKDPKPTYTVEEVDQYKKVLEFKERIQSIGMTNSFVDGNDFKDRIYSLLTQIGLKFCLEKKSSITDEIFISSGSNTQQSLKNELLVVQQKTINEFKKIAYYIPRSIRQIIPNNGHQIQLSVSTEYKTLAEIVTTINRVVILGNAGTGKSIELQHLALNFSNQSTGFIPFYIRFNTYVDEDISELLPKQWKDINQEVVLLLFDGLDEIQSKHFNTAIRKIATFSQQFPDLKIVISCRTNFYEIPTDSIPGTLPEFQCFYLNDLSVDEIKRYVTKNLEIDGEIFIQNAFDANYFDLITNPFFLNILIDYFKKHGSLSVRRAEIIKEFILSRINLDTAHFNTTVDRVPTKEEILKQLQKVALAMEMVGRNFITTAELQKVINSQNDLDSLRYFSAFNKNTSVENSWSFEHNNIQEYLAASVLIEEPISTIKRIISFPPTYERVKPSWVNALSFLISITSQEEAEALINWLVKTEPEIIVKFERDRVNEDLRISLFKQIFTYYKDKGIWLNSNKFTDTELARFAESEEVIEYLVEELNNSENSKIIKMNAISLLDSIDFSSFPFYYLEKVKVILLELLEKNKNDSGFAYSILRGMAELGLNNKEIIKRVLSLFQNTQNQYIRSGIYKLIGNSEFVDEFIDVFLEGITLSNDDNKGEDREDVNLADESWLLREGLSKASSPTAIKKVFEMFSGSTGRKYSSFFYEKREVLKKVVTNAIIAYPVDHSIFDSAFNLFISSGKLYDLEDAKFLVVFFESTNTKLEAFRKLSDMPDISEYEKGILLVLLTDTEIINYVIAEYVNRNLTNEDLAGFHKNLLWHRSNTGKDVNLIEVFESQVKVKTNLELKKPDKIDFEGINQRKAQENFNILFDKELFFKETERVFLELGLAEINYDDLWQMRRNNNQLLDAYFPHSILDVLRDFARNSKKVDLQRVQKWLNSENFVLYQIGEIYDVLRENKNLEVSPNQRQFIETWSQETASKLDWQHIIKRNGVESESITVSKIAQFLWFFVDRLEVNIDEKYILNFTLFSDFDSNFHDNQYYVLNRIEELLNGKVVQDRVKKNIKNGINVSWVWKSNALYAIKKGLNEVYPKLIEDIKDQTKSEYQRNDVLVAYFNRTKNVNALHDILVNTENESLENTIIQLLLPISKEKTFLISYLSGKLKSTETPDSAKLKVAKALTELNDMSGLSFYTNYILEHGGGNFDFHQLNFLSKVTAIQAIPYLLDLLKIAKLPPLSEDKFNHMESFVLSAFQNIAVSSEENLFAVKSALTSFIAQNEDIIPNLNFLHYSIDRIEEQFYMNKSKSYSIEEAITQIQQINI